MNLPFTDFRSNPTQTSKQEKADDDSGRININDVNDGWTGEARLAEEEEALRKSCCQNVVSKIFRKPRTPPKKVVTRVTKI